MALPATESFTGAAGGLPNPPWTNRYVYFLGQDGAGHAALTYGFGEALWNADTFPDDQFSECVALWTPSIPTQDYLQLWTRGTFDFGAGDIGDGYFLATDGVSDTAIWKRVSGTDTSLATHNSFAFSSGDTIRLAVVGTTLEVTRNGASIFTTTDFTHASGAAGMGGIDGGAFLADNWQGDAATLSGPPPGTHVVSGRGNFAISTPAYLLVSLAGVGGSFQQGNAEPPNYYHVGMVSWGTSNGVFTAKVLTRTTEVLALPPGMTLLYYEFASGITATIVESGTP